MMNILKIPAAYLRGEDFEILKDSLSSRLRAYSKEEINSLYSECSPNEIYSMYKTAKLEDIFQFTKNKIGLPRELKKEASRHEKHQAKEKEQGSLFLENFDEYGEFLKLRESELRRYLG